MRSPLILDIPQIIDAKILIESNVIDVISKHRQNTPSKLEAGGILLGYRRGNHIHIAHASEPQKNDKRQRFNFFRQDQKHQELATSLWYSSGETIDYIGEWHTHPVKIPSPSSIDLREWSKICKFRKIPMVFVITGTHDDLWIGIGIKEGDAILPAITTHNLLLTTNTV